MRRYAFVLALLLPTSLLAQTLTTPCSACRDVREYPMDFGNHAFNEVFVKAEENTTILSATVTVRNPVHDCSSTLPVLSSTLSTVNPAGMVSTWWARSERISSSPASLDSEYPAIL